MLPYLSSRRRITPRCANANTGMEINMVRFVGWLTISGFAIYGLSQFIQNHVVLDANGE